MESDSGAPPSEPIDSGTWPEEIRELHSRIMRSALGAGPAEDMESGLEHLFGLVQQAEDLGVQSAARWALLDVLCTILPEEMVRIAEGVRGRSAIDLAMKVMVSPDSDDLAKDRADRVLALMAKKFPLRDRA